MKVNDYGIQIWKRQEVEKMINSIYKQKQLLIKKGFEPKFAIVSEYSFLMMLHSSCAISVNIEKAEEILGLKIVLDTKYTSTIPKVLCGPYDEIRILK